MKKISHICQLSSCQSLLSFHFADWKQFSSVFHWHNTSDCVSLERAPAANLENGARATAAGT